MLNGLDDAAKLLADAGVEVIVFHCTAVSTFAPHLAGDIRGRISRATGVPSFATSDAILAACEELSARRVLLLTPYIAAVHEREIRFLSAAGKSVVGDACLGINTNDMMARLSPEELFEWANGVASTTPTADLCFVSCTALRSAPGNRGVGVSYRHAGHYQQSGDGLVLVAVCRANRRCARLWSPL